MLADIIIAVLAVLAVGLMIYIKVEEVRGKSGCCSSDCSHCDVKDCEYKNLKK